MDENERKPAGGRPATELNETASMEQDRVRPGKDAKLRHGEDRSAKGIVGDSDDEDDQPAS